MAFFVAIQETCVQKPHLLHHLMERVSERAGYSPPGASKWTDRQLERLFCVRNILSASTLLISCLCNRACFCFEKMRGGGSGGDAIFSAKCSDPSAASICLYQVARRSLACDTRLFISFALFSSSCRARERKVHSHSRCTCKSSELHSAESLTGDGVKWRHCVKWIENRQHRFLLESRRSLSFILWESSSTLQPRTKD